MVGIGRGKMKDLEKVFFAVKLPRYLLRGPEIFSFILMLNMVTMMTATWFEVGFKMDMRATWQHSLRLNLCSTALVLALRRVNMTRNDEWIRMGVACVMCVYIDTIYINIL